MDKRVIVCNEKHDDRYYEASTDQEWAESALKILSERYNEGYWYYDPREETHPFSLKLRAEKEQAAALELTEEQFKTLPEAMQKTITAARKRWQSELDEEQADIDFIKRVEAVVTNNDTSFTDGPRPVPKAWQLLLERKDHEYEYVSLETLN